jgi:hypothetical protein
MTTAKPETLASETPRTDALAQIHDEADPSVGATAGYNDLLDFARQLECELRALPASPSAQPEPVADVIFNVIKHGDEKHQAWLREKSYEVAALLSPSAEESARSGVEPKGCPTPGACSCRVPDGMRLVPKEPTEAMLGAGAKAMFVDTKMRDAVNFCRKAYKAMCAAAPEAVRVNTGSGE